MMRRIFYVMACFAAAIVFSAALGRAADKPPFEGPMLLPALVDRVYDADTIYVDAMSWPDVLVDVGARIYGIDTPEKRGTGCKSHPRWKGKTVPPEIKAYENELGKAATKVVKGVIHKGDWVLLRNVQLGKYAGRVVADVHYATSLEVLKACAASLNLSACPSVAKMLVDRNLAVAYEGGTKHAWWCERPPKALPRAKPEDGEAD